MITRRNSGIFFCCISVVILLSCSKSNSSPAPILNIITYTITDTTNNSYTYSDTAKLNPDRSYGWIIDQKFVRADPIAYIWQPFPNNINRFEFYFVNNNKTSVSFNTMIFSLPWYQASVSGTNHDSLLPPFGLIWKGIGYGVGIPQIQTGVTNTVYLAYCTYGTNISDSSNNYVSGSFYFSGTTVDSGKMQIAGKFSNLPTDFKP